MRRSSIITACVLAVLLVMLLSTRGFGVLDRIEIAATMRDIPVPRGALNHSVEVRCVARCWFAPEIAGASTAYYPPGTDAGALLQAFLAQAPPSLGAPIVTRGEDGAGWSASFVGGEHVLFCGAVPDNTLTPPPVVLGCFME